MEFKDHGKRSKIKLFSWNLNHCVENGWMTDKEKQLIEDNKKFNDMQKSSFELIRSMKSEDNAARLLWSFRCFDETYELFNKTGWDEIKFQSLIMRKVFEKGLITLEEKLSFEEKMYVNTMKYRKASARNPMQNDVIIDCIFKYLNVKNIGKSRLISKKWSKIGLPYLKTRARIAFITFDDKRKLIEAEDGKDYYQELPDRTPEDFFETFPELTKSIPFTAFRFFSNTGQNWEVKALNAFFDSYKNNIRELKLERMEFFHNFFEDISSIDISTWIAGSALTTEDPQYNTKLEIEYEHDLKPYCLIKISSTVLKRIKILKLKFCEVHLMGEKISPIELELSYVSFFRDGNKLPSFCINDAFDLSNLKRLSLDIKNDSDCKLDLSGKFNLDYLNVPWTVLTNWDTCQWTVNKLFLKYKDPFIEKTDMKIKELRLSRSMVNLSILPQSIEKLNIEMIERDFCYSSQPSVLHNLHYLRLFFIHRLHFSTIQHFGHCQNLIALELITVGSTKLQLSWIPKSVKRLKLSGYKVSNPPGRNEVLYLEKLVLLEYYLQDVHAICDMRIHSKELVLLLKKKEKFKKSKIFDIQNLNPAFLHRVYVGHCDNDIKDVWGRNVYEYYGFEKHQQKITAISEKEFEKMKDIQDN